MDNIEILPPSKPPEEKQHNGCAVTILLLIIGIIIVIGILLFGYSSCDKPNNNSQNNNNGNEITTPFKKVAPGFSLECTLTGILFNIQCNDNYSYIIIQVELLDKNENIVKSFTMREDDMKKGELRQAEYKFSIGEVFTSNLVKARIEEYK